LGVDRSHNRDDVGIGSAPLPEDDGDESLLEPVSVAGGKGVVAPGAL